MAAIAMRATMTKRMASKGPISQGAQTFGVTNFAWGLQLRAQHTSGRSANRSPGRRYLPPLRVACLTMLVLVWRVACRASDQKDAAPASATS